MAAGTDAIGNGHARALPAAMLAGPAAAERSVADALRAMIAGATHPARPGQPGPPIGIADVATTLWTQFHKFDAADPLWPDRDRFVLSASNRPILLYALLHLTGHAGIDADELKRLCRPRSPGSGHPALALHPTLGRANFPLGQGIATAVGMALAERTLAARFGRSLVDHRTWAIASGCDVMEGVSHEAASLAGHLRLEKLTVLWDDSVATQDSDPALASSEDTLRRFAAYGWAVRRIDGHDPGEVATALGMAMRSKKPTLVAARTCRERAAPDRCEGAAPRGNGAAASHDARPADEAELDRAEAPFAAPEAIAEWHRAGLRGAMARRGWLKRLARHPQRLEFERVTAGRLPDGLRETFAALKAGFARSDLPEATRDASARIVASLAAAMPELVVGSADPSGTFGVPTAGMHPIGPLNYGGRYLQLASGAHALAAASNGVALHGGMAPLAASACGAGDAMRPALRLAALLRHRVVFAMTSEAIDAGQDGATYPPLEQLASLRAMPNMVVFRPACPVETAECWELAMRRTTGPSVLALSAMPLATARNENPENRCARGGYVLAEAPGARRATLIASGAEVALALEARALLAACGMSVAVVSLPSWELFSAQDDDYREAVLGQGTRVGIEAACGFGWERWLGPDGVFIGLVDPGGLSDHGAWAPGEDSRRTFGITAEAIVGTVRRRLG